MRCGWVLACVLGCSGAQKPGTPAGSVAAGTVVVVDARRAESQLSCAHCHASRQEADAGQLSPGPPWPGTMQRKVLKGQPGMDAATASDLCAATYQDRGLSARERVDVVAFLDAQGPVMEGEPEAYDGRAAGVEDARRVADLEGDGVVGEALFARACARCHRHGPGYPLGALMGSSRLEILVKVMLPQDNRRAGMPHYPVGRLTAQELADIAAYVNPQN